MKDKDLSLRRRKSHKEHKIGRPKENDDRFPTSPYDIDKLAMFLFIAVPVVISCLIGYYYYRDMMRNLVVRPYDSPLVSLSDNNKSRYWGTYRPGLYFGTKVRTEDSPVTGLMWFDNEVLQRPSIRHLCEQGDRLQSYGWIKHNGNDFGIHTAVDNNYTVISEFVKRTGGEHGGDWSARIKARAQTQTRPKTISLLYYFATNEPADILPEIRGNDHLVSLKGQHKDLGKFKITFKTKSEKTSYNHLISHTPGYEYIQQVVDRALEIRTGAAGQHIGLKGRMVMANSPGPNLYVFQVTAKLPTTLEVMYESESYSDRPDSLQGSVLTAEIEKKAKEFDEKFEEVFKLKKKGYSDEKIDFSKAALSNMLGGIGYYYGASQVQSVYNEEPVQYWNAPLFTAVPSRSFFPRGFLWDEGFHNLLIKEWDQSLSMDIIGHWMNLMNKEGWIPREQILGGEARAKVPAEFIVQRNENANPPTFFLPLESIIQSLIETNSTDSREYLSSLYPRLQLWYNWFNKTQHGSAAFTYRWKGRNPEATKEINPKTLTSGLDDYPRASHPSYEERHLDLRCWMALASKVMTGIAKALEQPWQKYHDTYSILSDNQLLNELHWSDKDKRYADYGFHTDHCKLKRPPPPKNLRPGDPIPERDLERVVYNTPDLGLVTSHFGYVSLFPLLTQILEPDSMQLGETLKSLRDENLLWTDYGLRSLAKSSPLYQKHNTQHDPPYWRGAIWININYLTVRSLHYYSVLPGKYRSEAQKLYTELRDNIIDNIYREYKRTGYIWEQYDDKTGYGKGCHPFTGWSALVTLMMAEI